MECVIFSLTILLFVGLANGRINDEYNTKASNYCGLINCEYYRADNSYYSEYISIENLTNAKPQEGYILRFPLFIIGNRNAHIVFTDHESPDWDIDIGYEFVLGGWGNSRIAIRNINGYKEFVFRYIDNIVSGDKPTLFFFEITDRYIRVYLNNNTVPLIAAFDLKPLQVKYFSFRSHERDILEYFYNCPSLKDDILSPPTAATPAADDDEDLSNAPLNVLATKCKSHDEWNGDDLSIFDFTSFARHESETNKTIFEVYVVIIHYARIVLLPQESISSESYYEFIIDERFNAKLLLRHGYYSSETLGSFQLETHPSAVESVKITFEFSANGLIEVFLGPSSYKPSISTTPTPQININYFGFSTSGDKRTLYYFGCPVKNVTRVHYDILPAEDFNDDKGSLAQNCTRLNIQNQVLTDYIQLSSFAANVQPDGYLIRLPFYVQASSGVHILLTPGFDTNNKQLYEFVIDDYDKTSVSKNRGILADVVETGILNYDRPVRIVLEITNDGKIRIFTQHNKLKPLLEIQDSNPITNLKYVGFGGKSRATEFAYDCSKFKPMEIDSVTTEATANISPVVVATKRESSGSSV